MSRIILVHIFVNAIRYLLFGVVFERIVGDILDKRYFDFIIVHGKYIVIYAVP